MTDQTDESFVCIDPLQRHLLGTKIYPRSIMNQIFHRTSLSVPLLFGTKTDQLTNSLALKLEKCKIQKCFMSITVIYQAKLHQPNKKEGEIHNNAFIVIQ